MQLDRVVVPPGLFNAARTYSLVRDDAGLYMIYTGPAMGPAPQGGGLAGVAAGAILGRMADKRATAIAEVEAQLRQSSPAAMQHTKHSRFIPRASIKSVTIKDTSMPIVVLQADKKVTLHLDGHHPETVRSFFEPLTPRP